MYETTYHRPSSVDEAAALFAKGTEAKYLAGGQTLLPVMKQRLASPSDVIDLAKIKELVGVVPTNNGIEIKAATTHYDVAQNDAVKKANWSAGALDSVKISADGLLDDLHGSASYRANLIKVMAQRAVIAAG